MNLKEPKLIAGFTAIAPKLTLNTGTLDYRLWVHPDGGLLFQIVANKLTDGSSSTHPDLLFRVSDFSTGDFLDQETLNNPPPMKGLDPQTFQPTTRDSTAIPGFVKAVLKHLYSL